MTDVDRDTADRVWLVGWLGLPALGIANGNIREFAYRDRLGDRAAHQVSTATLLAAMGSYIWMLERRWPLRSTKQALGVGGVWAGLTILFEFGFGHWVAGQSWSQLRRDYDLRHGRLWVLIPIATALGPAAAHAARSRTLVVTDERWEGGRHASARGGRVDVR
jgi:hypothetical protein